MTFRDIIGDVDEFFPNASTFDEKLKFANNLSAIINKNYIKNTKTIEYAGGESPSLPAGVTPDLVKNIYIDGNRQNGESVLGILSKASGKDVVIEYTDVPIYNADDEIPVSAPFDNLYLYYILAFICLHTNDTDGYNTNMAIYSTYLKDYENSMSQVEGENLRFKNLW